MTMKKIGYPVGVLLILAFFYVYVSTLLFGEVQAPSLPVTARYDVMEEAAVEAQKVTGQDWLWWDKDSYIDYFFTPGKRWMDIEIGGAKANVMMGRLYFGQDGVYEPQAQEIVFYAMRHNAAPIPEGANCVRIYPIGNILEPGQAVEDLHYLTIRSLAVTDGKPGEWLLFGTVMGLATLASLALYLLLFCRQSFWFSKTFRFKYLAALGIIFAVIFIMKEVYYPYNGITYFGDAGVYYTNGDTFLKDRTFAFSNYLHTDPGKTFRFRGCLQPLLILGMKQIGSWLGIGKDLSYDILSSLLFSVFFAIGLPKLWELVLRKRVSLMQILLPFTLAVVFLRGLLVYPLSDLYSVMFGVYAVLGLLLALRAKRHITGLAWAGFAGGSLYLAYNIRSANMLLVLGALPAFVYAGRKVWKRTVLQLLVVMIAMLLTALPQVAVNQALCQVSSPLVQTSAYKAGKKDIFVGQLSAGWKITRFESELSAGNTELSRQYESPMGRVFYVKYASDIGSMGDFLRVCLQHPFTVALIWGLHFLVAMDLRFLDIINGSLNHLNGITFILNILTIWGGVLLLWQEGKRIQRQGVKALVQRKQLFWILLLVLPSLAQIVGAFETRFGAMLYLQCFAGMAFCDTWPTWRGKRSEHVGKLLILLVLLLGLGLVWSMAYATPNIGSAVLMD